MASAKVFENASQLTIHGSEFNAIAGDQVTVNHNYTGDGPSTHLISGRRDLFQFCIIPDGDVFVLSTRSSVIKDSQDKTIDMFKTVALTWVTKLRQLLELSREKPSWGVRVYEGTRQTLALARIVISSPRPNSGPSYDISTKEPSLWSRIIPY
ncbi:hypothetical protein BDP27DRAFT_1408409 [Rhodocollybia butyracea]|uniref:Uncharacterized protein n=1 Tax=Rhodocollybia butyracea TaxID=206335 RepID=A0A9P5P7B0_9AGAR|nr:hypothetical protein BDP27DRAFT_1408409 [Rhodocollybia butyracea]